MITPINDNLVVQPVKHDSFVPTNKGVYEEKGVVIEVPQEWGDYTGFPKKGETVLFDSWLCGKYPGEKEGESIWIVNLKDVRAIERI